MVMATDVGILGFIGLAVVHVMRDRPADLVESRRRGRIAFVAAIWLYACVAIVLQLVYDGRLPPLLVRANVLLVLIVELLNSSVEAAIDRISLERHELSKRAKDFGSAAVMVALGVCVITWGLILLTLASPLASVWLARIL